MLRMGRWEHMDLEVNTIIMDTMKKNTYYVVADQF